MCVSKGLDFLPYLFLVHLIEMKFIKMGDLRLSMGDTPDAYMNIGGYY